MTPNDVSKILSRLAVIETKLDSQSVDSSRVRRLEMIVAVLLGSWGVDAFHIPTPFS